MLDTYLLHLSGRPSGPVVKEMNAQVVDTEERYNASVSHPSRIYQEQRAE